MKISHGQLEACVQDPNRWMSDRRQQGQRVFSIGYDQVLLLGIYAFHRTGREEKGREWLDSLFQKHSTKLPTRNRIDGVYERYRKYTSWCSRSRVAVAEYRVILEGAFDTFLTLGGFLHRIDTTATGVRGVVLGNYGSSWRSQLRMPLIQLALAQRYTMDVQAVAVAVQDLDGSALREETFDSPRLRTARQEFRSISAYVQQRWGGLSP